MIATTPSPYDTRLDRWRKILTFLQTKPGALAHNNLNLNDSLRRVLVKVLRSINGV